jgi:putative transferase (TIGR04331 family)
MPYHWSDYSKFNQDHKYLDTLYEKVLRSVVKCLNDLHDINGSVRYWRTIIGPWLYYFVQIFYDRWKMITNTISEYNIAETIIFELDPKDMIANDMSDFNDARYGSDIWNHWIYGEIIKQHSSVDITYLKILNKTILNKKKVSSYSTKDYSLKLLKYFINKLASSFKKIDYFFINFPKIQQWNLEISLKQFPTSWYSPSIKNYKLDMHKRNNIK